MKSSVLSLVLVAGLAAAQSSKLPTCATKCINEYTTGGKISGCGQVDVKCLCGNSDFLNGISCCLQDSCDTAGQEAAIKYAGQICSSAGVTVPNKLSCNSSNKSGSKTATQSSSDKTASSDSTATGSAATESADSTGSSTKSATGSAASSTNSGSAAAGSYSAGGLLGALAAVVFAL